MDKKKTEVITVRLTPEIANWIEVEAAKQRRSKSDMTRILIEDRVKASKIGY